MNFAVLDFTSRWYKNCKRQRKAAAKICGDCPFRAEIEEEEQRRDHGARGRCIVCGTNHNIPDPLPQCNRCGSSYLWLDSGIGICCNPECPGIYRPGVKYPMGDNNVDRSIE
jgi:hypothetical protein